MAVRILNFVWIFIWCTSNTLAYDNPKASLLEKKLSISFQNISIPQALQKIETATGIVFSYSPTIFSAQASIDKQFTNVSVRQLLDHLFEGDIVYKERKKYIILTKNTSRAKDQVEGYISDSKTGERLRNVSIYNPVTMESVITDEHGFFVMPVSQPSNEALKLTIKRLDYADTVISVKQDKRRLLDITLDKTATKLTVAADSVSARVKRIWLATKKLTAQSAHLKNIDDTLHQPFQFSVVPFVGTNMKLSGNTVNDYSLNVIGGYSKGVRKLEVGGVFNMVNGHVKGFQVAGSVNIVTGDVEAVQIAGSVNLNNGRVRGIQWAGLLNVNRMETSSVSGAGLLNIIMNNSEGVKLAGLGNVMAKGSNDASLAGLWNVALGTSSGAQISGIMNVAMNDFSGAQIGLINLAKNVRGTQIGFINVSDSLRGLPIGFLSFVRKNGYHKVEVSVDEVMNNNIAFRTGVHGFYNILMVGADASTYKNDATLWTFGYGVGTAPKLSKRFYLNFDFTAQQVLLGNAVENLNLINKVFVGGEYQLFNKIGVSAGVTLNTWISDNEQPSLEIFRTYTPQLLHNESFNDHYQARMWIGGKLAIRFF